MSIHAALVHRTRYTYDRLVEHGPHVVRLRPAPHCKTHVLSYSLKTTGGQVFTNWQQDPFSNWNARLVFPDPLKELLIEVELVVESRSLLNTNPACCGTLPPFAWSIPPDKNWPLTRPSGNRRCS